MRLVFMGSPKEVIAPLDALCRHAAAVGDELVTVVSQAARPVGRRLIETDPPVAQHAKAAGLKVLQPLKANDPDFLAALRALAPDVIITAAYGQILSEEFLTIPQRATINIHPSLLPAYRGATPVPAALLDGLNETGVSILFTVRAMDAGNLILQEAATVLEDETQEALTGRLFERGGSLLPRALELLRDQTFRGTPQDESQVTQCRKIKKEHGEIQWQRPAHEIKRRFQAYFPWPGSFTHCGGKKVTLMALKKWPRDTARPSLASGELSLAKALKGLAVGTGDGEPLLITRIKPEGGQEMEASAFWNGLKPGTERRLT